MSLTAIQSLVFHQALLRGASRVESKRDELNRINGFPVPDRDTGNNLAYLMRALSQHAAHQGLLADTLAAISQTALINARGNSGAIFSQFFAGLADAARKARDTVRDTLPLSSLGEMFRCGYDFAYRSIAKPREGTVLTAMRAFSETLHELLSLGQDLAAAAKAAMARLRECVAQSARLLPQQRALRAPDAGAMAFFYFAEGFLGALTGLFASDSALEDISAGLPEETVEMEPTQAGYRYCTEALIRLRPGADPDALRGTLAQMGDSLVVSANGDMARVHLHTDDAAATVDVMESLGALMEVKADDMLAQQRLAASYPGQCALVVDSIADAPAQAFGVHTYVLPMTLLADGVSYQDKRSISPARVLKLSGKLTSSQLNLQEISAFLLPIAQKYDSVLILTVSAAMSGLHARVNEFIAQHPDLRLRAVDTRTNSAAEGLLALEAQRMLEAGKSMEETARHIEGMRSRAKILVSLPNLKAMVASGRLKERVGKLLMSLRFLPLVTINAHGEGTITGISFSRKRSDKLLLAKIRNGNVEKYAVVHMNDLPRAQAAARRIQEATGLAPEYVTEISSVVANFSGDTAYAAAYLEKVKK